MFGFSENHQAIGFPFNWSADYANGKNVTEYDLITHKKNDFYQIDRTQVIRFGLFGHNMKFYFEMYDGSFNLRGRRIDLEYHTRDGEVFGLTANFSKKDIITYKEAYTNINLRDKESQGVQDSMLKSINFGYKTIYSRENLNLFFQAVVSLQLADRPMIEVKITSDRDLDGYIVFKSRGVEVERFEAPLKANKAGQINWTVK